MDNKFRVLVVDDEEIVRESLSDWLQKYGYQVGTAVDGPSALAKVQQQSWNALLVDLKMPGMDGLEVLRRSRQMQPGATVIIMTAYASVDTAVQAMKDGAYDYLVKPFDPEEISLMMKKLVERQALIEENIFLKKELAKRYGFKDIIGKSPKMQEVFELIKAVGPEKSTVLIQGESGTGKEVLARAIHEISPRREKGFIAVSCGALTESLLESELFGHEKGAFTGAAAQKKGRFELADEGTLFLDEIADISPKNQLDLLRVIERKEFTRVGGTKSIKVDVRIIAATNKDIQKLAQAGKFREDLYYRLNVIMVVLPPLRERREDIPLLADHFLQKCNIETGKKIQRISEDLLALFLRYDWPGNVRELANVIERVVVLEKTNLLTRSGLPPALVKIESTGVSLVDKPLHIVEKEYIAKMLHRYQWNIQRAAELLEIDRTTLYNKIKRYELRKND